MLKESSVYSASNSTEKQLLKRRKQHNLAEMIVTCWVAGKAGSRVREQLLVFQG